MKEIHYDKITNIVRDMKDDHDKFFNKKNKTAGTRLRASLQEIANLSKSLRKDIQEIKNGDSKK